MRSTLAEGILRGAHLYQAQAFAGANALVAIHIRKTPLQSAAVETEGAGQYFHTAVLLFSTARTRMSG